MRNLDKRIHTLEKSFDTYDSALSHLSDEELRERAAKLLFKLGYRVAEEGEIPEADINKEKFASPVPGIENFNREELDAHMRLGGIVPNENFRLSRTTSVEG